MPINCTIIIAGGRSFLSPVRPEQVWKGQIELVLLFLLLTSQTVTPAGTSYCTSRTCRLFRRLPVFYQACYCLCCETSFNLSPDIEPDRMYHAVRAHTAASLINGAGIYRSHPLNGRKHLKQCYMGGVFQKPEAAVHASDRFYNTLSHQPLKNLG